MDTFKFLLLIVLNAATNSAQTPPFECKDTDVCLSSLTQKDCPSGEFITKDGGLNGCCAGCKGGAIPNQPCSDDQPCAPGLKCLDYGEYASCALDKSTCAYTYHLTHLRALPTCEIDGTFAAIQCKGDRASGRCFCYSENGNRIHGWAWWRQADDMTCACSRLKHKLNLQGQEMNTLHCDQIGNFERLQCNDGVCWCADPKTGELANGTRAVPESMWTFLPCYDAGEMGTRYLRQCESAAFAQKQLKRAYNLHGTTKIEFNDIKCDFDGAYGTYRILNGIASCIGRDGTKLGSFQAPSNLVSKMNCYCARDQKIFEAAGLIHRLTCSGNGNYESIQDINGKVFCVDRDGFAVSEAEETEVLPNCAEFLYYETTKADKEYVDLEEDVYDYPE